MKWCGHSPYPCQGILSVLAKLSVNVGIKRLLSPSYRQSESTRVGIIHKILTSNVPGILNPDITSLLKSCGASKCPGSMQPSLFPFKSCVQATAAEPLKGNRTIETLPPVRSTLNFAFGQRKQRGIGSKTFPCKSYTKSCDAFQGRIQMRLFASSNLASYTIWYSPGPCPIAPMLVRKFPLRSNSLNGFGRRPCTKM